MAAEPDGNRDDELFATAALDVSRILAVLESKGAISLPLLREDARRRLLAEAQRAPYRRAREATGAPDRVVRQDLDVCDAFPRDSAFHGFRRRFQALLDTRFADLERYPFETSLALDDMMLQRYPAGSFGITPHRDGWRYVNLVCLFTLAGSARFGLCADRSGRQLHEFDAAPGTVIFMRAPGFLGSGERPFHFVGEVREVRYSFGLRQLRAE